MKHIQRNILYRYIVGVFGFLVLIGLAFLSFLPAQADNPTFFFSDSSACGHAVTSLPLMQDQEMTLYICLDADNEGLGLLGAETNVSYSVSAMKVSGVVCELFDTCINLSESGTIKLLGASGPHPDGQAASSQRVFGHFSLTPKTPGRYPFSFILSEVINQNQEVENRGSIGISIEVTASAEEEGVEEEVGEGEGIHMAAEDYNAMAEISLIQNEAQSSFDIQIPSALQNDDCVNSSSDLFDGDQDGLSDRTECYLNTDPNHPDTDQDGCWDGDEINLFYSNPLDPSDCNNEDFMQNKVLITDPKPDWIVKTFDVSGIAPLKARSVGISAFLALHKPLAPVIEGFEAITKADDQHEEQLKTILASLSRDFVKLNDFLEVYGDDYDGLGDLVNRSEAFFKNDPEFIMNSLDLASTLLNELKTFRTSAIFLGEVTELKEAGIGQMVTAGFHLTPDKVAENGIYDLVATALLEDGSYLSSPPLRVVLDSTLSISAPRPESLDNIVILTGSGNIRVENGRPILRGQGAYGSQIFATWESLVLASSIIADSEEGSFNIQAPRELERNLEHTVTVYAVSQQERGMVRSESATVDFIVVKPSMKYSYWLIALLGLMAVAAVVAKRRMLGIDRLAPEHRSKENELYIAFGVETAKDEILPENHEEKQKEVEDAFNGEDKEPTVS